MKEFAKWFIGMVTVLDYATLPLWANLASQKTHGSHAELVESYLGLIPFFDSVQGLDITLLVLILLSIVLICVLYLGRFIRYVAAPLLCLFLLMLAWGHM